VSIEKQKYILEIDETQAHILSQACEFLSRIAMGQFTEITSSLMFQWKGQRENRDQAEACLDLAKNLLTQLNGNQYFSIRAPDVQEKFKIAYDLHQVIRHRLAWDRDAAPSWNVHKDEPWRTSQDTPLAQIQEKE